MSHMVSEHCKINVAAALDVHFCTCPVELTIACRSTILSLRIVETCRTLLLLCICGTGESYLQRKSELTHDLEDGILSSCSSTTDVGHKELPNGRCLSIAIKAGTPVHYFRELLS